MGQTGTRGHFQKGRVAWEQGPRCVGVGTRGDPWGVRLMAPAPRFGTGPRSYAVRVGDHHTLVREEFEEELGVQQVVVHPEYRLDGSDYDIALVRLWGHEQCASLGSHVLPACLPLPRERPQRTASNCYITGWGDTGKGRAAGDSGAAPSGWCLGVPARSVSSGRKSYRIQAELFGNSTKCEMLVSLKEARNDVIFCL